MSTLKIAALVGHVALLIALAAVACGETDLASVPTSTAIPATSAKIVTVAPALTTPASAAKATSVPPGPSSEPIAVSSLVPQEPTPAPSPEPTAVPSSVPAEPTPSPVPAVATPTPDPFAAVTGIVDPTNHGWPRQVVGLNGLVTIPDKPLRIINASVGHDEVTLALVPIERLVGVGGSTKSHTYSNVAERVQDIAQISRDPEVIVAQSPDVIVTSPFFSAEGVEALTRLGVPVIQTELSNDPEIRIGNILLFGYIYGEEERALVVAAEVRARYKAITDITLDKPDDARPRVIALTSYSDKIWTAGIDSTEGSIIVAAGGRNVAAEAGIQQNNTTSLEGVIAMNPEIIIIPQPADGGGVEFKARLLGDAVLAQVPAIKDGRVYIVNSKLFTTLSFWNIRGVEEMARLLWPEDVGDREFPPFSFPQ